MREQSRHPILTLVDRDGDDRAWHAQAACAGLGDAMFPTYRDGRQVDYRDALFICHGNDTVPGCPVMSECLEWALAAEEPHGVWGGMNPTQRQRLARSRAKTNGHGTPAGYAAHRDADEPPCARCRGAMGALAVHGEAS